MAILQDPASLPYPGTRRLTADPALPASDYAAAAARYAERGEGLRAANGAAALSAVAAGARTVISLTRFLYDAVLRNFAAATRLQHGVSRPGQPLSHIVADAVAQAATATLHGMAGSVEIAALAGTAAVPALTLAGGIYLLGTAAARRSRRHAANVRTRAQVRRAARQHPGQFVDSRDLDPDLRPILERAQQLADGIRAARSTRSEPLPPGRAEDPALAEYAVGVMLEAVTASRQRARNAEPGMPPGRELPDAEGRILDSVLWQVRELEQSAASVRQAVSGPTGPAVKEGPGAPAGSGIPGRDTAADEESRPGRGAAAPGGESVAAAGPGFPATAADAARHAVLLLPRLRRHGQVGGLAGPGRGGHCDHREERLLGAGGGPGDPAGRRFRPMRAAGGGPPEVRFAHRGRFASGLP